MALHAEEAPALLVLTRPLQLGAAANCAGAATAGGGVEYTLTRWQTPSLSAGSPMRMVRSGGDLATLGDAELTGAPCALCGPAADWTSLASSVARPLARGVLPVRPFEPSPLGDRGDGGFCGFAGAAA